MKIWKAKAAVQKTISFLPFKHSVNRLFQTYVTKGVFLTDALMEDKLLHCKNHLKQFYSYRHKSEGFTSLEIGTGWYPIVPIGFYLAGAKDVFTIDVSDLLKQKAIHETIKKFQDWHLKGTLSQYIPGINKNRLEHLNTLLSMDLSPRLLLEQINIFSIVGDARATGFENEKFDLINSNNTFEHIYPDILVDILKEFHRVLKDDGLMVHSVDLSDHFAHLDKTITVFNYLQFSDAQWRFIDNSIQPQNRLRITDYRKLLDLTGFKILQEMNRMGSISELNSLRLDSKYKSYSKDDLAVTHSLLVSEKEHKPGGKTK